MVDDNDAGGAPCARAGAEELVCLVLPTRGAPDELPMDYDSSAPLCVPDPLDGSREYRALVVREVSDLIPDLGACESALYLFWIEVESVVVTVGPGYVAVWWVADGVSDCS